MLPGWMLPVPLLAVWPPPSLSEHGSTTVLALVRLRTTHTQPHSHTHTVTHTHLLHLDVRPLGVCGRERGLPALLHICTHANVNTLTMRGSGCVLVNVALHQLAWLRSITLLQPTTGTMTRVPSQACSHATSNRPPPTNWQAGPTNQPPRTVEVHEERGHAHEFRLGPRIVHGVIVGRV